MLRSFLIFIDWKNWFYHSIIASIIVFVSYSVRVSSSLRTCWEGEREIEWQFRNDRWIISRLVCEFLCKSVTSMIEETKLTKQRSPLFVKYHDITFLLFPYFKLFVTIPPRYYVLYTHTYVYIGWNILNNYPRIVRLLSTCCLWKRNKKK